MHINVLELAKSNVFDVFSLVISLYSSYIKYRIHLIQMILKNDIPSHMVYTKVLDKQNIIFYAKIPRTCTMAPPS